MMRNYDRRKIASSDIHEVQAGTRQATHEIHSCDRRSRIRRYVLFGHAQGLEQRPIAATAHG
jgi:hypothetical protein